MYIALFARSEHPEGWATPIYRQEGGVRTYSARGNGYSVLAITCENDMELDKILYYFQIEDFIGLGNEMRDYWFGGNFHHLATVKSDKFDIVNTLGLHHRFNCYGDNRYFGIYTAHEVLNLAKRRYKR